MKTLKDKMEELRRLSVGIVNDINDIDDKYVYEIMWKVISAAQEDDNTVVMKIVLSEDRLEKLEKMGFNVEYSVFTNRLTLSGW